MQNVPTTMKGVVLTGHGGLDRLQWRDDLPVPHPDRDEVLIAVAASSVNNTDINTRTGWYAKTVRGDTATGARDGYASGEADIGGWAGEALSFPRIQGADCCGRIVAVGDGVSSDRIGERVLVRTMQVSRFTDRPFESWTFGSECDGAFAEYTKAFASEAVPVTSDWSDLELATIPCAYSTAEGMLQRAGIGAERILVTGASGGVGSACIQLARRRGATITAMTNPDKADAVRALGAATVIGRHDPVPAGSFDAIIDLVAGPRWGAVLDGLVRGGRYVTSGAIAGPIVELDVRTLYLQDLTLFGSTFQPPNILSDVIGYIERGEIRPQLSSVFDLKDLRAAQEAFLEKAHVGKIAIRVAGGV